MFHTLIPGRSSAFAKKLMPFVIGLTVLVSSAANAGFIDEGGGVILDTTTNLEWEKNANHGPFDWAAAKAYTTGLILKGGGWRFPDIGQLQQLYDDIKALGGCARNDCTGDQGLFTGIQHQYWSATEIIAGKEARDFNMILGCQCRNGENIPIAAWAVRPAPEPASLLLFGVGALGLALSRRIGRRR
jgi:hypothetical protein